MVMQLVIGAIVFLLILPAILMTASPILNIIIRLGLAFIIFSNIRAHFGDSLLTLIISAVLIYILVIKWAIVTAPIYVFLFILVPAQFGSLAVWTIGSVFRKH